MRDEFLIKFDDIFKIQKLSVFKPDYLIPIPEEVNVTEDPLLTPFPIFVESPLINPCLRHD